MSSSLPPHWPRFTQEEADAVARVLLSNRVNQWTGEEVCSFEKEFADWCGADHAVALTNGTVALDLALKGLGIGAGDDVIVTPRSFIASASCVVNAGANPIFADVDRSSGNLSADTIEAALTERTKAVILVHLAGYPCDMDPIVALSKKHGFEIIEDCAQAHGARYKGKPVGSFGAVAAWSFCQDKIMTTGGEGGMVTTNDQDLWRRMWSFKDHGKDLEAIKRTDHPPGHRFIHTTIGTNWRMLEMQAVIGRIQLKRMDDWHAARTQNGERLARGLQPFADEVWGGGARSGEGCIRLYGLPCASCSGDCTASSGCAHAYYRYHFFVQPERLEQGWTRDRIVEEIAGAGVTCQQGTCSEIYEEDAFRLGPHYPSSPRPVARELGKTSVMLRTDPSLTDEDLDHMCTVLRDVLTAASRSR